MKKLLIHLALIVLLASCKSREEHIQGFWRTDSISNYVNGFSFTNNTFDAHWSYFEYKADGSLYERRKDEFRKSVYKFTQPDSLVYTDSTGAELTKYQVLHLDAKSLVLKKSKKPYLAGKDQELYEIRYFSKVPKDSLTAFSNK